VEEDVLISHLYCVEENTWTHVMPLNSKKLGGVFIELRVIPELFSDNISIQKATVL